MYQVKLENNGTLVVHTNNQSYTFKPATKQQKKHLDNVHKLARAAYFSGTVGADLERDNSEDLVKTLLGPHYTTLKQSSDSVCDEVAVIVFRWQVAGLHAAREAALGYNKRGANESNHW